VIAPDGTDRRGKIWGGLVPYGMSKDSFGTCGDECPWRAGANENTVFRVSHDVKVEGQPLAAGAYGLFMVPGPEEFTIVFSRNSTSWGHYFYDAKEDVLRVKVKPRKAPYTHWLTYDFVERKPSEATVALRWDELEVPIRVEVPDVDGLYLAEIRNQLRNATGFDWQAWEQAAQFCLGKKINLPEALKWAEHAATPGFTGQESFRTLSTLSQAQAANGMADAAKATMQKAMSHPTATAVDLHMYGRQLQAQKKTDEAVSVYLLNAKKHPEVWPVNVGLARAYAAQGKTKEALAAAKKALAQAPDDNNRNNLKSLIEKLEAGKPID
jgi:tetratricopeptide (TPR) repeat protein